MEPRVGPGLRASTSTHDGGRQHVLDVLEMHRLSRRRDGGASLLRWLARRTRCWVGLLDRSGRVLVDTTPGLDPDTAAVLVRGLEEMIARRLPTFVTSDGSERLALLLAVDASADGRSPVLAIVGPDSAPAPLAADAAVVLASCWSSEEARRMREQVALAEARCREAVLHLLMSRHTATARQLASTLSPTLSDTTRVHIIECAPERRSEVLDRCAELTGRSAWTVRCPVYVAHVIVLAPDSPGDSDRDHQPLEAALAAEIEDCVVGAGEAVPLRDVAVGYEQAFHALAVARGRAERSARFDAGLDLPTVVGAYGLTWANCLLAPLIAHVPARVTDPDAQELIATARSWLAFSTSATRHLKIHRNTLATRLRRLDELLGLDLSRTGQQATLDLALRIRATPCPDPTTLPAQSGHRPALDDLLRLPATQHWALATLRPLRDSTQAPALESTLRAWLDSDSRLSVTAEALGLSVPGARKRVARLEQVLHRSLLHGPSARHDLWLATRAVDLGPADAAAASGTGTAEFRRWAD